MRLFLLVLLLGCTSSPRPVAKPAPAGTTAHQDTPAAAKPPTPSPRFDVIVWTTYRDFAGHGMTGSGRFYRHEPTGWVSAPCHHRVIADPQAGPNGPPTCGEWTPVPADHGPVLDGLARGTDIVCSDRPDVCTRLGLVAQPVP